MQYDLSIQVCNIPKEYFEQNLIVKVSLHITVNRQVKSYPLGGEAPQASISIFNYLAPNMASIVPAATAVPITPATLGPIACINKKLAGFALAPTT